MGKILACPLHRKENWGPERRLVPSNRDNGWLVLGSWCRTQVNGCLVTECVFFPLGQAASVVAVISVGNFPMIPSPRSCTLNNLTWEVKRLIEGWVWAPQHLLCGTFFLLMTDQINVKTQHDLRFGNPGGAICHGLVQDVFPPITYP